MSIQEGQRRQNTISTLILPDIFTDSEALLSTAANMGVAIPDTLTPKSTQRLRGAVMERARELGIAIERPGRSIGKGENIIYKSPTHIFREGIPALTEALESSPAIKGIEFVHLENLQIDPDTGITLAIETCPLYLPGSLPESRLDTNPQGEASILASRVGNKWAAIKYTIQEFQKVISDMGLPFAIHAVFGDKGVIVGKERDANKDVISAHSDLYREQLTRFCRDREIAIEFHNLSEFPDPEEEEHRVPDFIVVENGGVTEETPSIEELVTILKLNTGDIPLSSNTQLKRAQVLQHAFENCGGSWPLWKGLVKTYLYYVPMSASRGNIHLGLERAEWLIKLQSVRTQSPQYKMPTINVAV